ncbi:hypothetical protein ACE6H2_009873 [Prunus campanulata]
MMKLFGPRMTTLIFVIRDKTKTPLEKLECQLRNDIQKIWESAPKPEDHKETPLSEFFNVEVVALSNYEDKEDTFKAEVACMRRKFFHHNKLAGDRQAVVPASGFSLSIQEIWEKIKKDRDLDIPSIKVMVATVRCEEIANEKYSDFAANEEWIELKVISIHPGGFGKKLSSMIDTCISEYDEEATYYDEGVKSVKRKQLEEKLLQLVQPAFQDLLELKRSFTLDKLKEAFDMALDGVKGFSVTARNVTEFFMAQFDEGCADAVIKQANWDTSKVRDKLMRDIGAHVASVHADKIKDHCEAKLRELLSGPVEALLKQANNMTWPTIRRRLQEAHESAFSGSAAAISGFDMDEQTKAKIDASLEKYVKRMVDAKAKEEAGRVLIHMKERFITKFSYDSNSIPRVWNRQENIGAIARTAHSSSLEVLSVMAVICLDGDDDDGDKIPATLNSALLDKDMSTTRHDPLASNTWEEFPSSKTLIIPLKCKELWGEFKADTKAIVSKAIAEQEANPRFPLPSWAIGCLIFVGYNAVTRLIRNPLCLGVGVILVAFLLVKPI